MHNTANQLYKQSGTDLSFKEWMKMQKEYSSFMINGKGMPSGKPNKEEARMIHCFKHFSFRLSERYNLLITYQHYKELSKIYLKYGVVKTKEGVRDCIVGFVKIHDTYVKVYKDKIKNGPLLTAVPLSEKDEPIIKAIFCKNVS